MSSAIFRKLPIIVFTWPTFSSISSSRASFVILWFVEKIFCFNCRLASINGFTKCDVLTFRCNRMASYVDHPSLLVAVDYSQLCHRLLPSMPLRPLWMRYSCEIKTNSESFPFKWKPRFDENNKPFPRKYTNATALLHSAQRFFGIHHIGTNFIHILLDSFQLFYEWNATEKDLITFIGITIWRNGMNGMNQLNTELNWWRNHTNSSTTNIWAKTIGKYRISNAKQKHC